MTDKPESQIDVLERLRLMISPDRKLVFAPAAFEQIGHFERETIELAIKTLATALPPANGDMRSKCITSAEWEAATAAAERGIRGGWQRGSDFVHVVAVALGMNGGSAMASANTAHPAPAEGLREYFEATEALIVLDGQTDDPAGFIVDWASDDLEEEDQAKWERFCDARDAIRAFDTSAQGQ